MPTTRSCVWLATTGDIMASPIFCIMIRLFLIYNLKMDISVGIQVTCRPFNAYGCVPSWGAPTGVTIAPHIPYPCLWNSPDN